jgi:GH24 family phage-related lysozyme (muramidase)
MPPLILDTKYSKYTKLTSIQPKTIPGIETRISSLISEKFNEQTKTDIHEKYEKYKKYEKFNFSEITGFNRDRTENHIKNIDKEIKKLSNTLKEKKQIKKSQSSDMIKDIDDSFKDNPENINNTTNNAKEINRVLNLNTDTNQDIADTNRSILSKLTEIEANQVDEQDTSIQKEQNIRKISDISESNSVPSLPEANTWTKMGILGLVGSSIGSLLLGIDNVKLGQFGLKIIKLGIPFFTKEINKIGSDAFKLIMKASQPIIDKAKYMLKYLEEATKPIMNIVNNIKTYFRKIIGMVPEFIRGNIPDKLKKFLGLSKVSQLNPIDNPKVGNSVAKKVSATTAKTIGKKIPFLGLGISSGLAISRASAGDYVGAAGEIASGVASIIPGIGTALSLGIDAALIHRDFNNKSTSKISAAPTAQTIPKFSKTTPDISTKISNDEEMNNIKDEIKKLTQKYSELNKTQGSVTGIQTQQFQNQMKELSSKALQREKNIKNKYNGINSDTGLINQIKKHEGFSSTYYKDAHGYSIGYGHFSKGKGSIPVKDILGYNPGNKITKEEGEILLKYDLNKAKTGLLNKFPWVTKQPTVIKNNLIDMTYNMGLGGISEFKPTLNHIKNKEYIKVAKRLVNTKWYSQVGKRARNIVNDFVNMGNSGINVMNNNNPSNQPLVESNIKKREYNKLKLSNNITETARQTNIIQVHTPASNQNQNAINNVAVNNINNERGASDNLMNIFSTPQPKEI